MVTEKHGLPRARTRSWLRFGFRSTMVLILLFAIGLVIKTSPLSTTLSFDRIG
ncbi:hypothetical protein TBK1r_35240 [Stieleria magnilauensis]|uniref:Uncharacterized protein n=1 Tax=Stieleria magnilauensis TaxID=2527963 RepID=A0ABX5XRC5_9BACT|nr:hypothetical protein TBK1r_35240 [Planctomycetes bacterium TBK1r]